MNTHLRTQWLFYVDEVSPHFHHYYILVQFHSCQFSLPWWQPPNMASLRCPSQSPCTLQHIRKSHKYKSCRPLTDLQTGGLFQHPLPNSCSIHWMVKLPNSVNAWPQVGIAAWRKTCKVVSLPQGHTVHVWSPSGTSANENTRPIS